MMRRWLPGIAVLLLCTSARADQWHAGTFLRAELGTHPIRAGGGVTLGDWDFTAVLDPMFWTDGQVDTDVLAQWEFSPKGWSVLGGWRATAIGLEGGHQFQQRVVAGIGAPLPGLRSWPVRARWAFETTVVVVKHGADLPSSWISFASGRDFIDLINFGMFVSFEYARRL